MAYEDDAKNVMLDELGTLITYVGLLDDEDSEVSGGSPAYARKAITWDAAASGEMAASNQPEFDIPTGTTVAKVIFMSAISGGTKYGEATIVEEIFNNQGILILLTTTLDLNA